MAITFWGVQGTVNEVQWANLAQGFSQKYTLVRGNPVTASGRVVTIPARLSVGCGVAVDNNTNETLTVPTPAAGQWHLLVLRRVWGASRGASYMLIPGPTTTDALQTTPPTSLPGVRNVTPGVMDDEPVAWVHTRASVTTLTLFQMSARQNGVVFGPWGLWSGAEQGIYRALSLSDSREYRWSGTAWVLADMGHITLARSTGTANVAAGTRFLDTAVTGLAVGTVVEVEIDALTVSGTAGAYDTLTLRYTTDGTAPTSASALLENRTMRTMPLPAGNGVVGMPGIRARHIIPAARRIRVAAFCTANVYGPDGYNLTITRVG